MDNHYYGVNLSKLSKEEKGDVSQRLHELQETCLKLDGNIGIVYGQSGTVQLLQKEGWDVNLVEGVR
jgi:hypothetical protein